ncbi:MAG: O-antigen ligase family protein, partial [Elusimicrobia bacterium]|nr:O-antigen ligase family protein [Elusimicrobiota bacterium]
IKTRKKIWIISTKMLKNNILIGIGAGLYTKNFNSKKYRGNILPPKGAASCHPHSIYLTFLVGGGIVAFLGFAFLLIKIFLLYFRKPVKNKLYYGCMCAIISVFVASFFQNYLTDGECSALFWILLGILALFKNNKISQSFTL